MSSLLSKKWNQATGRGAPACDVARCAKVKVGITSFAALSKAAACEWLASFLISTGNSVIRSC